MVAGQARPLRTNAANDCIQRCLASPMSTFHPKQPLGFRLREGIWDATLNG
jgi:hypothetical protein